MSLEGPFATYVDTSTGQQVLLPASMGGGSAVQRNQLHVMQQNLAIALSKSSREWVSGMFVDCTNVGADNEIIIPFPVTGRLTRIVAACNFAPDADMPFTTYINGIAVTGGVITIPNGTPAGTVFTAEPTANHAGTYGTSSAQVVLTLNNTARGHAFFHFGFTLG